MNRPARIVSAIHLGSCRVKLAFTDGFEGVIDLEPALHGHYLQPLRDAALFRQVSVSHGTLVWPNEADFCPDVLRYWCELGRVCTDDELNAHFHPSDAGLILNDKPNS